MRTNLIKNYTNFKGISINNANKQKNSQSHESIEQIRREISQNDSLNEFQERNRRINKITQTMNKRRSYIDKLPWYKRHQKPLHNITLEEISKKQSESQIQKGALAKIKADAISSAKKVDNLESELAAKDARQKQINRMIADIKVGDYRAKEGFSQLAGYQKEKDILYRYFIYEIAKSKNGHSANIPNAILFFGPKGNGKTTFATAFAQEIGCDEALSVKALGLNLSKRADAFHECLIKQAELSKKIYESEGKISILFIDELGNLLNESSPRYKDTVDFMQDCYNKYHCIVFAVTNYPLKISLSADDNEIFPFIVSVDPPNDDNKREILEYYLKDKLTTKITDNDYDHLVNLLKQQEFSSDGAYSVSQLKYNICEANSDSKIEYNKIVTNILSESGKPNISLHQLEEHEKAYQKLMTNEVDE